MAKVRGAYLPDLIPLIQAGIDTRTGLPVKVTSGMKSALKGDIKKFLRLLDEADAVNRFVWYNLPGDITSQELERMLYYKGQLCLFYQKTLDKFYFMPYALDGSIDAYGRFNTIHPVPMTSGVEEDKHIDKALAQLFSNTKLTCKYAIAEDGVKEEEKDKVCVLIHDYSKQLSQLILPRVTVNDPLLDVMAECVPVMRTSLILSTGIKGVRVNDADQADSVKDGSRALENAAMVGDGFVPIVGGIEFQELTNGALAKSEEYMLALQSLDNLRLSGYGIDNGGLFEKKSHILQDEADINGGPVGLVLQDGLSIRQNFCNIVNSIWDLGIWCEPAQNIMGMDTDGDGAMYDDNSDGSNTGVEEAPKGEE